MYFSAICLIYCAFYIYSACCGLITERLKLSQVSEACPPGVWTCSTGKRSEIAKVEDISRTVQRRAVKSYPPGIWIRHELEETEQLTDNEDPKTCPPGMWVDKKKRTLKQMLKRALKTSQQDGGLVARFNPSQVSNDACPPGVWTCSKGKRSEITKEGQVEAPVPDESQITLLKPRQILPSRASNEEVIKNWRSFACDVKRVVSRQFFKLKTSWLITVMFY